MASIHREVLIDNAPENVWAAVRDFGEVHKRLAPGYVTDTRVEDDIRIVTFANGAVVRELIVDIDDEALRETIRFSGARSLAARWSPNTTTRPCRSSVTPRTAAASSGSST